MDDYGATDPAEFFAVATETFFEKSRQFRHGTNPTPATLVQASTFRGHVAGSSL